MFNSYNDICLFLNKLGLFHMDLGLQRVEKALEILQLTKPPFVTVQVVGTNGKGSTATFLESLSRAHGLRTGLFTSPHFVSPCERIQVNGQPLSLEHWPALANTVHKAAPTLTYFEFLTVLAALAFTKAGIDIAIIEAGLGGHYDATTALARDALCITPISLDHQSVLGNNLLAIAQDKAHAMGTGMPVFLGKQEPHVFNFLQNFSLERGAILHLTESKTILPPYPLGLHGTHQINNATLALSAWHWLAQKYAWPSTKAHIHKGLASAFIAGRLQHIITTEDTLPKHLLLDGAHNTQGLEVLYDYVKQLDIKPGAIIFSCLADKDTKHMLPLLQKIHALCGDCPWYLADIQHNDRALTQEQKQEFSKILGKKIQLISDLNTGLAATRATSPTQPILICGSLYLLGDFFAKYPHYLSKTRGKN